jgi:hypothetical protein
MSNNNNILHHIHYHEYDEEKLLDDLGIKSSDIDQFITDITRRLKKGDKSVKAIYLMLKCYSEDELSELLDTLIDIPNNILYLNIELYYIKSKEIISKLAEFIAKSTSIKIFVVSSCLGEIIIPIIDSLKYNKSLHTICCPSLSYKNDSVKESIIEVLNHNNSIKNIYMDI